jgi:hypothetical protein
MSYYDVGTGGTVQDMVISNSVMSLINPEQGGHPLKMLEYIKGNFEKANSKSLETGKLLHSYIEDPESFKVMDFDLPNKDTFNRLVPDYVFQQFPNKDDLEFYFEEPRPGKKLTKLFNPEIYRDIVDAVGLKIAQGLSPEGLAYLNFLYESRDAFAVTKSDKKILEGCVTSLRSNEHVEKILFNQPNSPSHEHTYSEIAIYFTMKVPIKVGLQDVKVEIPCKALIDRLIVNEVGSVLIVDLKTTSRSLYTFQYAFERFRYYRQLAFYKLAVSKWLKGTAQAQTRDGSAVIYPPAMTKNGPNIFTTIVAVETGEYNLSAPMPISSEWIKKGTNEYRELLQRIAWHTHQIKWSRSKEEETKAGQWILKDPEYEANKGEITDLYRKFNALESIVKRKLA